MCVNNIQSFLNNFYIYMSLSYESYESSDHLDISPNNHLINETIYEDMEMGVLNKNNMHISTIPENILNILPRNINIKSYLIDIKQGSNSGNIIIYLGNKERYIIPIKNYKIDGYICIYSYGIPICIKIKYSEDVCMNLYEKYYDDKLTNRYTLLNGKYNGIVETWCNDFKTYEIIEYKSGVMDGVYEKYINNKITTYGYHIKNLKENVWRYYNNADEYEDIEYKKDVKDGAYKKYINNKIQTEGYYINNLKNNTWKIYNDNNNYECIEYKDDIKSGIYKKYLNDKISVTGYYIKDLKDNIWEYYNEEELLLHSELYSNGKIINIFDLIIK